MLNSRRARIVAAALSFLAPAVTASAQTVIARSAPPGQTVELVLNTAKIATAAADTTGNARLPFNLTDYGGKTEMDATVHVDVCPDLTRVVLVERAMAPAPPDAGCTRKDVVGVFWVRRVSTLVVETAAVNATVFLRQGPVDLTAKGPSGRYDSTPTGLIVFGGAGIGSFRDALDSLCGSVSPCDGGDSRTTYAAGGTFWFSPFVAVEGSYLKPAGVNVNGTGSNFSFNGVLSTRVYVINGKVGIPVGRTRIYGQGGTNYHRGTLTTTETINNSTVTVNGVIEPVAGGSQTIELETGGWGWQFGGGLEVWVKPSAAIFGEYDRTRINGKGLEGDQGELKDYLTAAIVGVRIRIHR